MCSRFEANRRVRMDGRRESIISELPLVCDSGLAARSCSAGESRRFGAPSLRGNGAERTSSGELRGEVKVDPSARTLPARDRARQRVKRNLAFRTKSANARALLKVFANAGVRRVHRNDRKGPSDQVSEITVYGRRGRLLVPNERTEDSRSLRLSRGALITAGARLMLALSSMRGGGRRTFAFADRIRWRSWPRAGGARALPGGRSRFRMGLPRFARFVERVEAIVRVRSVTPRQGGSRVDPAI